MTSKDIFTLKDRSKIHSKLKIENGQVTDQTTTGKLYNALIFSENDNEAKDKLIAHQEEVIKAMAETVNNYRKEIEELKKI